LKKSLKLFVAGIIAAIIIIELEGLGQSNHPDDILNFFIFSLSYGGYFAAISYYVMLIIILPIIAFPDLKEKLGSRIMSAYVFVAGVTFWGAVDGLYIRLFL